MPYSYITCHRTDESCTPYSRIIVRSLKDDIQIGDIIVCCTNASHKGSNGSIFRLFDIAKVVNILEEDNYAISILSNARNSYTFEMIPIFERFFNMI